MKKDTQKRHSKIANDVMHYIYKYINTDINLDELSISLNISKFHMHRVFKEEFEQNIYQTIKSIRLQKAVSLLLTNKNSTLSEVARVCGYSSQAAFIRVFKTKYNMTPKYYRNGGYKELISFNCLKKFNLKAKIVKIEEQKAYYIRHKGDKESFCKAWEKIDTWLLLKGYKKAKRINLFHHNIAIDLLDDSRCTAAVILDENIKDTTFATLTMPSAVFAKFTFNGSYEEFKSFVIWVYFDWLINSGFEATTEPSFVVYNNTNYLINEGCLNLDFYICICM
ncbi:AraC family transcriptional regulator [Malaciobacter halophilus]|uniref:AraC family transcriptional regulator n=1 Tax=Malaciobacter halophilus TaxID=197482 RepID=A0A2N1J644_9BACT|nr:AraC family transcriptional regulator [Malaciobacter halophilus]AXH08807.1 transcriptional regulator, AraC family (GyrI domain) [Malaciobacter halophilus]PKI82038.1 AraC family transcriptional regulator [Malaciobacter halophilus]